MVFILCTPFFLGGGGFKNATNTGKIKYQIINLIKFNKIEFLHNFIIENFPGI